MSKFLSRLVDSYVEKPFILCLTLGQFSVPDCRSTYTQCYMDIKRGGKTEQSTTFSLTEGKNLVQFQSTFTKRVRWNEKTSKSGELHYQEKFMTVTMYGTTENGV